MRRVWGRVNSSNVMKVLWLLDELGLDHQRIDAGGAFGVTHSPEYLARNPMGLVPTYEEDGFVLWESNVILRYLAGRHASGGKAALWPAEPHARAHVDQWMEWQQTALLRPVSVLFLGLARTAPEQRDAAAIAGAVAEAGRLWGMLDARLAGREFVCGEALTLADVALGPHVHRWLSYPIARPDLPHLAAWYRRLCAREAYRARVAAIAVG